MNGGQYFHFLTRRRGAAVRTPAFVRRFPASGHRHKRGLAQPLYREYIGRSDAQDQSRSRLRTDYLEPRFIVDSS